MFMANLLDFTVELKLPFRFYNNYILPKNKGGGKRRLMSYDPQIPKISKLA